MKQSKLIQRAKQFMAGVVAMAMTVTMLPAASATAAEAQEKYPYTLFAASDVEGAITITGNACINGNIATNGTAAVTGSAINVNGTIAEQVKENMIDISAKLDELYFAGENVEIFWDNYISEEVNSNISNPTVVQGSMEVKGNVNLNASVKVSEDITIEADSLNANNAVLYSENGDISISGNNVNFTGLLYAPEGDISISAQHVNLNSVIVIADTITLAAGNANINYNQNMAEMVGVNSGQDTAEPDAEAVVLFLLGGYNAENHSIDMEWYTNATESDVTVWTSDDNATYEQEAVVSGVTTYQYVIIEDFETKYFKASVTDEIGNILETVPFVVVKNENGYAVSMLDSDGDGVADEYEILAGTDVNNSDTDGDTLTDYEELYISHTDATKFDSVTEGIFDAEADSDNDKLSNREELNNSTDVQNPDTDNDTLTDYEEIKVYNTDPLKADTDGDTLKDGDEIALGLDPRNPMTFGVPDAEYTMEQSISADSKALEEINTDDNEYRLAVDVTASGYVEGNLTAKETGYAAAIQNEFMVGIASELSYTNEDGIESVTLTFELDDEVIEDSLGLFPGVEELTGIKRFNVFKYFEELNMLLPIETVVDEENNRIYATTDELGIYCVMDMELWFASFDVPEEVYQDAPATFSLREDEATDEFAEEEMLFDISGTPEEVTEIEEIVPVADEEQDVPMLFALNRPTNVTPIDVAFLLQSSGQLPDTFTTQKAMLVNLLGALSEEYGEGNVRFTVISYNLYGAEVLTTESGEMWFVNDNALHSVLDTIEYQYTYGYTDRGNAFETLQNEVEFKENASKFIFQIMNGSTDVGNAYFDQISTCAKLGINYSELMPEGYFYLNPTYGQQVADAIASTNGMNATYGSTSPLEVYNHIVTYAAPPQVTFEAFVPSGWKNIVLDGILDAENGVNSDTDDLTDWQEVNTELLSWDTDGTVILPTIQDCVDMVDKPYAEAGVERYLQSKSSGMSPINFDRLVDQVWNSLHILPIHSDPTTVDTDADGLDDYVEKNIGTSSLSIDTDGDLIDDEEETFIGLDPISDDTDGDLLNDGLEFALGYDPKDPNPDGDAYTDYVEYISGKDPFVFEYEKTFEDHVGAIGYGVIFGDFADEDLIDTDVLIGQIGGSFFPIVGDVRDTIANAIKGDGFMTLMSAVGLIPVVGDAAKTVANLGQTIVKLGDDIPTITKLVIGVAEEYPSTVKFFSKSDEVAEAIESSAKSQDITKESLEKVMKCADEASIVIPKSSDLFKTSDNVIENVDELADVWTHGQCKRGDIIDRFINKHVGDQGLGRTFPIADRVDKRVLISTKSIDLGANSYKNANTLRNRIQSYINKLDGIENKYRDILENGLQWTKDSKPLHYTDYDSKLVEIVIPDIPLSTKQVEVLQEFLDAGKISIIIIK